LRKGPSKRAFSFYTILSMHRQITRAGNRRVVETRAYTRNVPQIFLRAEISAQMFA
jgi:hypothetical protein